MISTRAIVLFTVLLAVTATWAAVLPQAASWDESADSPTSRIIGGGVVPAQSHNYVAAVHSTSRGFLCGGVILNRRFILTAAHCTQTDYAQTLRVRVGSKQKSSYGVLLQIQQINRHPNVDYYNRNNDIATLKTSTQIVFNAYVSAISISSAHYETSNAVVSGWGQTTLNSNSPYSEQLRYLNTRTITNNDCKNRYANRPAQAANIRNTNICTQSNGNGICTGDNGSPLTVNGQLVGIATWTSACGGYYPDVFVRVSSYYSWIQQNSREYY